MAKKDISERAKARKLKLFAKFFTIVTISALASVSVLGFMSYSQYQEMKEKVEIDRIYRNIYINDLYLGGLTKDQAYDKLYDSLQKQLDEKTITLYSGDKRLDLKYKDFEARYDFASAIDEAYKYAKDGNVKQRYDKITALEDNALKIEYTLDYSYNTDLIIDLITPFEDEVYISPVEATIRRENGEMIITGGTNGQAMDTIATANKIEEYLSRYLEGGLEVVVKEIAPTYTESDLQNVQSLLGSYSSKFSPGENGRNQNIINALSKINNVVLYPGEVFSTNYLFGAMTYDNGYRLAPEIVNGKLQDGYGGGVCQVSSTLYNSVLLSELEIVERRNHSLKVAYMDYGFDATLAGDYIDFKFKNSTPYPLIVEAYAENGNTCIVNIYGFEEHDQNRRITFYNELVSTIKPEPAKIIEDATLPLGERVVVTSEKAGYKYNVYKSVYDGDTLVETVFINSSTYRTTQGEIRVGTKAPQPVQTEQPVIADDYTPIYPPIIPEGQS